MKKSLILFLMAVGFSSCVKDEGNYTYTEVNEITIEGLEESYYALQGVDVLEIQPKITSTLLGENLDNYEFQWHLHQGLAEHKHTLIYKGKEKDLTYKVDAPLGDYTLYFTVLDKTTGIKAMASAPLTVANSTTRGFLLFGDDLEEDIMGLDMVVMPTGRDTVVVENVYDNSETRFRNADQILFQGKYPKSSTGQDLQTLWMCTEDGSFRMSNREDISIIAELNDFGIIELSKDFTYNKPMRIKDVFPHQAFTNMSNMYRGYMTEDVCVFGSAATAEYYATPINRLSDTSKELFKFYPLAFMNAARGSAFSTNYAIIYNMDDNCFMGIYYSKGYALTLKENANDKFPCKQDNRTIVWGGNAVNTYSYALMKDLSDTPNYYLYQFKPGSYTAWSNSATMTKQNAYTIDLSKATNLDKASHYMVSGSGSILLYTYGSTLYLYNYQYGDLISQDMGGEITYLDYEYNSTMSTTAFIIATYNDTDKGIVRKLNVGTDPNKLEIIENPKEVWHTRLRVKDVEWKDSM